ncbi:MAG: XRE family transcriptional regulator [Oscillospiraceae bacterium]
MKDEKFYKHLAYNLLTMEGLADNIGMHRATLYRRIEKNGETFTVKEIEEISRQLALSKREMLDIFFNS